MSDGQFVSLSVDRYGEELLRIYPNSRSDDKTTVTNRVIDELATLLDEEKPRPSGKRDEEPGRGKDAGERRENSSAGGEGRS